VPKKKKAPRKTKATPARNGLSAADAAQLLALLQQQRGGFEPSGHPTPEPKPRARRRTPALFRVRVDLDGSSPPIWRRLVLRSDLRLDEVHEALQISFGWDGGHLHDFRAAGDVRTAERFLAEPEFDGYEMDGTPESKVYLDQLLVEPGDRLTYTYDFGDDWQHTIRLEEVLPQDADAPRVSLIGGRRAAPPDDCGGIYGYQMLLATLADPSDPEHERLSEWFEGYVDDVSGFDPAKVDIEAIDDVLRRFF
jgi:hypothetical protein